MENKALENIMTDYVTRTMKTVTEYNTQLFQAWVDMNTRMMQVNPVTSWMNPTNKSTKN
jgi:hypothetical protein